MIAYTHFRNKKNDFKQKSALYLSLMCIDDVCFSAGTHWRCRNVKYIRLLILQVAAWSFDLHKIRFWRFVVSSFYCDIFLMGLKLHKVFIFWF